MDDGTEHEGVDALLLEPASGQPEQELDTLQLALREQQQEQQWQGPAAGWFNGYQQQQVVAPRGLGLALPELRRRRLQQPQQQQQRLPRRLLMPHEQQQQHDDVLMSEAAADEGMRALEALDVAELGAAAGPSSATAAAARLCHGLQSLQGLLGSSAAEQDRLDDSGRTNANSGGLGIHIRVEGPNSGLSGLQCEGLVQNSNEAAWVVLDKGGEGAVQQYRRQQQATLLPGL